MPSDQLQLLLRFVGVVLVSVATTRHWITEDQAKTIGQIASDPLLLTALAALVGLFWASHRKVTQGQKMTLTAAAMPGPVSMDEVKAEVAAGNAPSLKTPTDVAPQLASTTTKATDEG